MIHAGGASARSLNGVGERLDDQFTVVTYDRRGFAHSELDGRMVSLRCRGPPAGG
jgi:pimeloyl-ACP methyl ester carboxylesterase